MIMTSMIFFLLTPSITLENLTVGNDFFKINTIVFHVKSFDQ